ncbi:MAG: aldehyde dehydrogenase family protein [Dehalococcoidales bacterium]
MTRYQMHIAGKWVDAESGKTFPVYNPTNGEEIAQLPLGGKEDVDKAVMAAKDAFPVWSKKPQAERSQIAMKIAALIRDNAKELGRIDTLDHGSPTKMAAVLAASTATRFEWAAYNARSLMGHTIPSNSSELVYLQREPIGVIALITPWNAPLSMIVGKLAPALTLGNTCIIKPPSIDSLSALKLAELLAQLELPPGVVNVITGPGGAVGGALSSHRGVDMVAFTGSSEVGKEIMVAASRTVKRLQLELGGKNPVIVLEDADIDTAVSAMATRQFANSGQICSSPGRFYIHEKVYEQFLKKFTKAAMSVVVGDPADEKTEMGPVVSAEHRNSIEAHIKSAVDEGANVVLGGARPSHPSFKKGCYVMPTVITDITQNMTVAREEIFGPVACFMEKFSSDEKVIAMANDNIFGLSAYVWTKDMARGMRFANEIQAGTVWLSNTYKQGPELPWGGFKESGVGIEGSLYGLVEYTNLKRVQVDLTK